jgi:hypothetical protein
MLVDGEAENSGKFGDFLSSAIEIACFYGTFFATNREALEASHQGQQLWGW